MRRAAVAALLMLAACSGEKEKPPQVHEAGAPPAVVAAAPTGPVEGVTLNAATVVLDGDRLFQPGTTELSAGAEPMLLKAAALAPRGGALVVSAYGADPGQAMQTAKAAMEALSYVGGLSFSRLQPQAVVDPTQGRRIVVAARPN
ncbi:hypothetical protein [Brevundimonas sp.]|jgi:hypothetical protein|uniref:hypothetical protein n=1 Tax=Brevundimonas sp. TaxID=1871086 RepID=UPI0037C1016B